MIGRKAWDVACFMTIVKCFSCDYCCSAV